MYTLLLMMEFTSNLSTIFAKRIVKNPFTNSDTCMYNCIKIKYLKHNTYYIFLRSKTRPIIKYAVDDPSHYSKISWLNHIFILGKYFVDYRKTISCIKRFFHNKENLHVWQWTVYLCLKSFVLINDHVIKIKNCQ